MKKHNGFTLIEVLIAMMLLAVGLLGLAALQAHSLKNNQSAYYRSQATQLAYDIADRMRVNTGVLDKYLSSFMKPEEAQAQTEHCLKISTTCTPEKMAEHDLFEWNAAIHSAILKNATGTIVKTGAEVKTYTITIAWDEKRDDDHDEKTLEKTSFDMSFRL